MLDNIFLFASMHAKAPFLWCGIGKGLLFLCMGKERDKETHPLASGAKSVCEKWELWNSRGFNITPHLAPRSDSPRSISIFHKHFLHAPVGEMRDLVAGCKVHR